MCVCACVYTDMHTYKMTLYADFLYISMYLYTYTYEYMYMFLSIYLYICVDLVSLYISVDLYIYK